MLKKVWYAVSSSFLFILCALFLCVFCLLVVKPGTQQESVRAVVDTDFPDPVSTLRSSNVSALARRFDHPLPVFPDLQMDGQVESVSFEGQTFLLTTLRYDRFTIRCVRPALGAPLLMDPALSPAQIRTENDRTYAILSMPALYFFNRQTHCFYFADDSAAYSLQSDTLSLDELVRVASSLRLSL